MSYGTTTCGPTYTTAIRAEYRNEREAADTQLKLGQLKYQGSIRAYLTEFQALNNFARTAGEPLREKVDLAMPDALLDMRFAHYLEDFADDEGFLQATYQAGLQVEKKKALKQAREAVRPTGSSRPEENKREERKKNPTAEKTDNGKKGIRNQRTSSGSPAHGGRTRLRWKEFPMQNEPTSARRDATVVEDGGAARISVMQEPRPMVWNFPGLHGQHQQETNDEGKGKKNQLPRPKHRKSRRLR